MPLGDNFLRVISNFFSAPANGEGNGAAASGKKREVPGLPTCVEDIMTRSVVTLSPEQGFGEALALMANRPFRHILVVEKDARLVGVISDRDLLRLLARGHEWKNISVGEVMTKETVTVKPETPVSVAVGEMLVRRINCLPVIDRDKRLCGIVTSTDLLDVFHKIQASLERVTRGESE